MNTITVKMLLNARPIIQKMNNTIFTFGVAYRFKKLVNECNVVYRQFEEQRAALELKFTKPGKEDKDVNVFINKTARVDFGKAIEAVLDEVIPDFPEFAFTVNELASAEITPGSLEVIDWFIK